MNVTCTGRNNKNQNASRIGWPPCPENPDIHIKSKKFVTSLLCTIFIIFLFLLILIFLIFRSTRNHQEIIHRIAIVIWRKQKITDNRIYPFTVLPPYFLPKFHELSLILFFSYFPISLPGQFLSNGHISNLFFVKCFTFFFIFNQW